MGIKQKFFMLSGLIGAIMAIVSCIGYYTAYSNLEDSVEKELMATVETQGEALDGWLREKAVPAVSAANLMASFNGDITTNDIQKMMALASSDKEIMGLTNGNESGAFMDAKADNTGKVDPRGRGWYKDAKAAGKLIFTDAYNDATTGKLVVSAAMPYKDQTGNFRGAICDDITLDTLKERVKAVTYRGAGTGFIIEKSGKIIASTNDSDVMTDVKDNDGMGRHFQEMVQKGKGFFLSEHSGNTVVMAYTTVPSTNWVVVIGVDSASVFAAVQKLKIMYAILTIVGILLIVIASLRFSGMITTNVIRLKEHADKLAEGDLRVEDLPVESRDELGTLAETFNMMSHNIRELIRKMATTAEQVAAAAEELTASAQQSAEAANHVAGTVSQVSDGMQDQLESINHAKQDVDIVYTDITQVSGKTKNVTENSAKTAEAAQQGERLMTGAMSKMGHIETSVAESAEVVRKLGENSKQIGEIVDAISAIADQTNLLALNAAIEAARAGEHGRGFAVVAEEVRKLAGESQKSAEEIKERIGIIQRDTEQAVTSMENGTGEVKLGATAIREVGTQFADIMRMVDEIKQQMEDVNGSVTAVTGGATRIVQAVDAIDTVSRSTSEHTQSISAATEEQSASTEEIASASRSLATMASELQEATNKFKI